MILFLVLLSALKDSEHKEETRAIRIALRELGADTELMRRR